MKITWTCLLATLLDSVKDVQSRVLFDGCLVKIERNRPAFIPVLLFRDSMLLRDLRLKKCTCFHILELILSHKLTLPGWLIGSRLSQCVFIENNGDTNVCLIHFGLIASLLRKAEEGSPLISPKVSTFAYKNSQHNLCVVKSYLTWIMLGIQSV